MATTTMPAISNILRMVPLDLAFILFTDTKSMGIVGT